MAFRKNNFDCVGFPKAYASAIRQAVESDLMSWCASSATYIGTCYVGEFEWAGCRWRLTENMEWVDSIELIHGNPSAEDLTAALLKGKIST